MECCGESDDKSADASSPRGSQAVVGFRHRVDPPLVRFMNPDSHVDGSVVGSELTSCSLGLRDAIFPAQSDDQTCERLKLLVDKS